MSARAILAIFAVSFVLSGLASFVGVMLVGG